MNCEKWFFKCFEMQMVINLAPVSLNNKKVNFYSCPRLTFLKKNAIENAYKNISKPLDFKFFWGDMPLDPPSSSRLWRSKLASSCTEVWLWPDTMVYPILSIFWEFRFVLIFGCETSNITCLSISTLCPSSL